MSIVRRIARPLLAATFIESGVDAVLHPMPRAEAARPFARRLSGSLGVREDPELFVRVSGAVRIGAGALLATGRLPRLSALALSVTLAPDLVGDQPFWSQKDPEQRRDQRRALLTGLALLGGTLLAAVDTGGRPGLAWRGRHAVRHAEKTVQRAAIQARKASPLPSS
jgi:uncharacterized membrane protein YphA (DoxX/SURF4 family)